MDAAQAAYQKKEEEKLLSQLATMGEERDSLSASAGTLQVAIVKVGKDFLGKKDSDDDYEVGGDTSIASLLSDVEMTQFRTENLLNETLNSIQQLRAMEEAELRQQEGDDEAALAEGGQPVDDDEILSVTEVEGKVKADIGKVNTRLGSIFTKGKKTFNELYRSSLAKAAEEGNKVVIQEGTSPEDMIPLLNKKIELLRTENDLLVMKSQTIEKKFSSDYRMHMQQKKATEKEMKL